MADFGLNLSLFCVFLVSAKPMVTASVIRQLLTRVSKNQQIITNKII
jgi:preprotein translocase subunit SecY